MKWVETQEEKVKKTFYATKWNWSLPGFERIRSEQEFWDTNIHSHPLESTTNGELAYNINATTI